MRNVVVKSECWLWRCHQQHIFLALQKNYEPLVQSKCLLTNQNQNSQTLFGILRIKPFQAKKFTKLKKNVITKLARSSVRNTKKYVVSALTSPAVSQKQYLAPHPLAWSLTPWGPSRVESSPRHLALGADLIMPSPSVIYPHQHMASLVTMTRNRYPNHTTTG